MSLQRGINLRALAEKMGQCSGAEVRGICTEAGMYALRERRQHVTQEDFEFAVAKVRRSHDAVRVMTSNPVPCPVGSQEEPGGQHLRQQVVLVDAASFCICKLELFSILACALISGENSGLVPGAKASANTSGERM